MADFNTIDDFDVNGKTVLLRIDINSPVDPNSGIILDDTRMKLHSETIKELSCTCDWIPTAITPRRRS